MQRKIQTEVAGAEPEQLALGLYPELSRQRVPVKSAPNKFFLKKANLFIDAGNNDLTLVARKLVNACFFAARQQIHARGNNNHGIFEFPADYILWLAGYSSRNVRHLRETFESIQRTLLKIDDGEYRWRSINFLSDVTMHYNTLRIVIPQFIIEHMINPHKFTLLSMRIMAGFESVYSLGLYEMCSSERENNVTEFISIDELKSRFGIVGQYQRDFSELRRWVLDVAVKEVNEKTDIHVEYELKREGRKFGAIRFTVTESQDPKWRVSDERMTQQMWSILKEEFRLSNSDIQTLSEFPDDFLMEKIKLVRARRSMRTRGGKIGIPGAYLMSAVKDDYRPTEEEELFLESEDAKSLHAHAPVSFGKAKVAAEAAAAAFERFMRLPEEEKVSVLSLFAKTTDIEYARAAGLTGDILNVIETIPTVRDDFDRHLKQYFGR